MFMMRFDMRVPRESKATASELYAAALDMAKWGEEHGAIQIVVSEHHASPDGDLPAPIVMAAPVGSSALASASSFAAGTPGPVQRVQNNPI